MKLELFHLKCKKKKKKKNEENLSSLEICLILDEDPSNMLI